jgi:hypothetical protein
MSLNNNMQYRSLKALMDSELPSLSYQRARKYRPKLKEIKAIYRCINREVFYGRLKMPKFEVREIRGAWGACEGKSDKRYKSKSNCVLWLADRWYCRQWLVSTLAHEMVHQYQWDIYSNKRIKCGKEPLMSHGPSFHIWRKKLKKFGITLKTTGNHIAWLRTQDKKYC